MKVHDSARKHGIAAEDALHAAEHAAFVANLEDDSPRGNCALASTPLTASLKSWCCASTAETNSSSTP